MSCPDDVDELMEYVLSALLDGSPPSQTAEESCGTGISSLDTGGEADFEGDLERVLTSDLMLSPSPSLLFELVERVKRVATLLLAYDELMLLLFRHQCYSIRADLCACTQWWRDYQVMILSME